MASTYGGDPQNSLPDQVRFILGDTGPDFQLSDGEVAYLLSASANQPYRAAIAGCTALIAKMSALVDQSVGSVSVSYSQMRAGYESLLTTLQEQINRSGSFGFRAYAGGTSRSDKMAVSQNPDRVAPYFRRRPSRYGWGADVVGTPPPDCDRERDALP